MVKEFIDEIHASLPESVSGFLETQIGEIEELTMPETREQAVIVCGQFAAIMNNALLRPFAGLTPIEVLMRIGQKNAVHIAAMLSGLEAISGSGGKLTILSPKAGGIYPNWMEEGFVCTGQGIDSVSVSVGGASLSMSETEGVWRGSLSKPLDSGKHSAVFTATFNDESTSSKSVEFETTSTPDIVSTYPAHEITYYPENMTEVVVELSPEADADAVEVSIFGEVLQLVKEAGNTFKANIPLAVEIIKNDFKGMQTMAIAIKKGTVDVAKEGVNFMIEWIGGEEEEGGA